MNAAIIVASGSSRRMGFDKLMAPLAGCPVLWHSITAFDRCSVIDQITLVTDEERFSALDLSHIQTPITRVDGGTERQDSVQNGLATLDERYQLVAIHDGARPLITPESIDLILSATHQHGAASLARQITETLKRANNDGLVSDSVNRDNLWSMETPQCFSLEKLKEAYQEVINERLKVTDEVSVFQHLDWPVKLISNPSANLKVTYPPDLEFCEALLRKKTQKSLPD